MIRLRENFVLSAQDFTKHLTTLSESEIKDRNISSTLRESASDELAESIKAGESLKEAVSANDVKKIIEDAIADLKKHGIREQFKVWRLPVARYDVKNLNGRVYPKALFENVMQNQRDAWCGLCGLADHPVGDDDPGLFRDQAVVWHDMDVGDDGIVYGICSFVGPYGHMAEEILEHGGRVGTSSSGFGDVDSITKIVDPSTYQIERLADLVLNPSQSTYGTIEGGSKKSFDTETQEPAVKEFSKPVISESITPKSKVLKREFDAANPAEQIKESIVKEEKQMEAKAFTKAEEKAVRKYIEKFIADANAIENPLDRLNECTEILSCFEEGYCPDLKESVEKQIVEEKKKLEELVENTMKTQKEYDMTIDQFKEAAERNTRQGLILNEQVADLNELVQGLTARNAKLSEENANLKKQLEKAEDGHTHEKMSLHENITETRTELDEATAQIKKQKATISRLMEKISNLSITNTHLDETNGVYETKLKEAMNLIKKNKEVRAEILNENAQLNEAKHVLAKQVLAERKTNKQLSETFDSQCKRFDELNEKYESYKDSVEAKMNPMNYVAKPSSEKIGKYLSMRESNGERITTYWNSLLERYGEAVMPFKSEILKCNTLREATEKFLEHRNDIITDFEKGAPVEFQNFRNGADKERVYEALDMYDSKKAYEELSDEQKNEIFLAKARAAGLQ